VTTDEVLSMSFTLLSIEDECLNHITSTSVVQNLAHLEISVTLWNDDNSGKTAQ